MYLYKLSLMIYTFIELYVEISLTVYSVRYIWTHANQGGPGNCEMQNLIFLQMSGLLQGTPT